MATVTHVAPIEGRILLELSIGEAAVLTSQMGKTSGAALRDELARVDRRWDLVGGRAIDALQQDHKIHYNLYDILDEAVKTALKGGK